MTNELTVTNEELIKQAQTLSGSGGSLSIPFIPIVKVNNKRDKKTVTIDGKEKEVEVLPDAGFLITNKDENTNEYTEEHFQDVIEAVILRVRYRIQEKYDQINPHKSFYSYEFDLNDQNIEVFDPQTKNVIGKGNYKQLKELFKIGETEEGIPKKSFNLLMILYIDIDDTVYRFERAVTMNDEWYKYANTFARNDTFVGYKTKFILNKEKVGSNEFWKLSFEKGKSVDLAKEIKLQTEISKFFDIAKSAREQKNTNTEVLPVIQQEEPFISDSDVTGDEPIDVDAIPF